MTPLVRNSRRAEPAGLAIVMILAVALTAFVSLSCGGGGGGGGSSFITPPPAPVPQPLSISTASLADAIHNRDYNQSLQATGGTAPYRWSVAQNSGAFPSGLSVVTAGSIQGFCTQPPGTFTVVIQVQDSANQTTTRQLSLRVAELLRAVGGNIPAAGVGFSYTHAFSASGGTAPLAWSVEPGSSLPSGLSLGSTGTLNGTPTTAGFFPMSIRVRDSGTPAQAEIMSTFLQIVNHLTVTKTALAYGVVDKQYSDTLEAAGGMPPLTWTLVPMPPFAVPPTGLVIMPNGNVVGTVTEVGHFRPRVEVRDSSSPPRIATEQLTMDIVPRIYFDSLTIGDTVTDINTQTGIYVNGGKPPYAARITGGALPPGFSLGSMFIPNQARVHFGITGTPTTPGLFGFTMEVADSSSPPDTISYQYSMRVNPRLVLSPTPANLPDGLEGGFYSFSFSASGGLAPLTWTISNLSLLPGLNIDPSTGLLSGTPTGSFSGQVQVAVRDVGNPSQGQSVNPVLKIIGRLGIFTKMLPPVKVNESIRILPSFRGGEPPYTWMIASGVLPAGLSFDPSSGAISGTPSNVESQALVLHLRDSSTSFPQTAQQALTLRVAAAPGRNDSVGTATSLSNGRYTASLSPPDANNAFAPDIDYYRVTANAGAIVTVETFAERLSPPAPLDTVIEIVDATGARLGSCNDIGPHTFLYSCMNDDGFAVFAVDSKLFFQVPGAAGTTTTFYVRVLSFDGNARPDYRYEISITGAN